MHVGLCVHVCYTYCSQAIVQFVLCMSGNPLPYEYDGQIIAKQVYITGLLIIYCVLSLGAIQLLSKLLTYIWHEIFGINTM